MESKVFYSWQSDLPNATNRGFIQSALENAVKSIRDDETIKVEPVIDRDTAGVPGSPDIADTILTKIGKSQIFVADVSIINNKGKTRKTPNPNVLLELGYAMKTLGLDRIIMVMNTAYGNPELLPFDLRMRRVVTYEIKENEIEKADQRKKLASIFESGIRAIITDLEDKIVTIPQPKPIYEQVLQAVLSSQKNQVLLTKEYMKFLRDQLIAIAPDFPGTNQKEEPDEILFQSITKTEQLVLDFSKLSEAIAMTNSEESAITMLKSFDLILERYDYTPPKFSGSFQETQHQFFKFMGHELFVIFTSFLIREGHWELLTNILEEGTIIRRNPYRAPELVSYQYISQYIRLFEYRKQRLKLNRMSIHADILHERHTNGELGEVCPIQQFVTADFFLYLPKDCNWKPWSTLYMYENFPQFIVEAKRKKYAEKLLKPARVNDLNELKQLITEKNSNLHRFWSSGFWDSSLDSFDLNSIGSI